MWRRRGWCCWFAGGGCWPDRFLDAGFAGCSLALVVLIGRYLLLWPEHSDGDLTAGSVDQIFVGKGGKAGGDNLNANGAPGGDDIDHRFTVGIGFDLQIALIFAVQTGAEDYGGVADRLAVELFHYSDFNMGGGRRSFVFATATGGSVLCHGRKAGNQGHAEEKGELEGTAELHGVILRRFTGSLRFWPLRTRVA